MRLETQKDVYLSRVVKALDEALGYKKDPNHSIVYGNIGDRVSGVPVGALVDNDIYVRNVEYVVIVNDPHERRPSRRTGMGPNLGSQFDIFGDKITVEVIERAKGILDAH